MSKKPRKTSGKKKHSSVTSKPRSSRPKYDFGGLKKLKISTISVYATTPSDLFLKQDLQPISDALSKICQLTGYQFSWKNFMPNAPRQVGLIAQDVEKVLPEAVSLHRDPNAAHGETIDTLGVDYLQIIALLVEGLKELRTKVELLQLRSA